MATELSKDEFCARFKAEMMKALPVFDGSGDELTAYADETAPTYFDMAERDDETPEGWAQCDISYWEEADD